MCKGGVHEKSNKAKGQKENQLFKKSIRVEPLGYFSTIF
jgi:hypothetical protein